MEEIVIVFTLAYALVSLCFVAPPREFVSAGLTVQNILSGYLGSEDMDFVGYHLKRTTATLLLHSLLPLGKLSNVSGKPNVWLYEYERLRRFTLFTLISSQMFFSGYLKSL